MPTPDVVNLKINSGGFQLAVSIHEPANQVQSATILCPGFLDSKDYPHLVALAETCAEQGILAARLDPVGTWASDGDESDYSITRYLENIATVDDYLRKTYSVDKLLIGGHSLGGFISIIYAAQSPSVAAVVGLCPPKEMLGTLAKNWQKDGVRHSVRDLPDSDGERSFDVPWAFIEDSRKYSALEAVKMYKNIPLILLAGSEDTTILATEVQEIYETAHEPKTYELIRGMQHDYRKDPRYVRLVTDKVMAWLRVRFEF